MFLPCTIFGDLAISEIRYAGESGEQEYAVLKLPHSFDTSAFHFPPGNYAKVVVDAKRSDGASVLDFSNLRTLEAIVSLSRTVASLQRKTLETLRYRVNFLQYECANLAEWKKKIPSSTLKRLDFVLSVEPRFRDPLCGLASDVVEIKRSISVQKKLSKLPKHFPRYPSRNPFSTQ